MTDADEPTVIGRRPVGPTRGVQRRPTPPPVAVNPALPLRPPMPSGPLPQEPLARGGDSIDAASAINHFIIEPRSPADALTSAAAPLFVIVAQLRNTLENADVEALRREMVDQLRRFEERAVRAQARGGDISAARYVMCALIDEAVMTTPWGSASSWSSNSLLNQFHNETWGGEKVFSILDRIRSEPANYLALLKLLDLCLLMGFEGKFGVLEGGRERLDDMRDEIGRLLRKHLPAPASELSAHWRGIASQRGMQYYVPLWVVFAIVGLLALIIYGYLRWRLSGELVPVETMLEALGKTGRT